MLCTWSQYNKRQRGGHLRQFVQGPVLALALAVSTQTLAQNKEHMGTHGDTHGHTQGAAVQHGSEPSRPMEARGDTMQGHQHQFNEPEAYAQRWEDEERDAWQQPQGLVDALGIRPGMSVADIGTGTGYLLPYLSRAAGSAGLVYAVDVSPNMLEWVRERAARESLGNVSTVAAGGARTGLASQSVDRAIMINVWHHVEQPEDYAADLLRSLKPGGVLLIVESRPEANEADGPPAHYRMSAQAVIQQLEQAGFTATVDPFQIDRQYVVRAQR